MYLNVKVEITSELDLRWVYSNEIKDFHAVPYKSRAKHMGFIGVYGWVEGLGSPPGHHLDVFVATQRTPSLGDTINCKLVGVFKRCDGDHKLLCIDPERPEEDLYGLTDKDRNMFFRLYEGNYEGDAWLGRAGALEILNAHDPTVKVRNYEKVSR